VKDYGDFDSKGHHSGAYARYCSETDLAGGEEADPKIFPPGWPPLMEDGRSTNPWLPETGQYKYARCHLIANQLGGDGYDPKNLITCLQMPVNSPLMSGMEGQVRTAVESGQQVNYWVKPIYRRNNKSAIPDMMRITAIGRYGDGTPGINMDNCLLNTMKPGNKVLNGAQCRP